MMEVLRHSLTMWSTSIQSAWTMLMNKIFAVAPDLIGAGLIMILGSLLAMGIGEAVGKIITALKVDVALEKTVLYPVSKSFGIKINVSKTFEELIKWFIVIIVFMAAADVANLHQVNDFLKEVLLYLPNVFVAVIILLIASVIATFVSNMITTSFKDDLGYLSGIAKVAILTFAILAALDQLQISRPLIEILFTGIVATCVLSFGLGGRDVAGDIVKKIYEDFQHRKKK